MPIPFDFRTVVLVLDPSFGNRLLPIAREKHVWIVASPMNDQAIDVARHFLSFSPNAGQLTRISVQKGESMSDLFIRALYAIDEHHGDESCNFSYQRLIVFGVPSALLTTELANELGLNPLSVEIADGFTVAKRGAGFAPR